MTCQKGNKKASFQEFHQKRQIKEENNSNGVTRNNLIYKYLATTVRYPFAHCKPTFIVEVDVEHVKEEQMYLESFHRPAS